MVVVTKSNLALLNLIMKLCICLMWFIPSLRSIRSIDHWIMAHLLIHSLMYSLPMRALWRSWCHMMHHGMLITIIPPSHVPLRIISVMCIYPISLIILRVLYLSTKSIMRRISQITKRWYLLISKLNMVLSKIYTLMHLALHLRLRPIKPYFSSFVMSLSRPMRKFQVSTQV